VSGETTEARAAATRQQVLILHLANRSLDSSTVAWALYDGASPDGSPPSRPGDGETPPYSSVVGALRDGWKLLQVPSSIVIPGREHETSGLPYEFVLTKEVARHD
jgi:hypothetical protein